MNWRSTLRISALIYRIALLVIVLGAIVYQLIPFFKGSPEFNLGNHFSLYTTQSNCSVLLVYILILINEKFTVFRGASLVYTLIATFGFWVLLGGLQSYPDSVSKIIACIRHGGSSLLVLIDIILFPNNRKLGFKSIGVWMSYPALFLVYSYIRFQFVHWMPYNFLDPSHVSSPLRLLVNICMLLLIGVVFAIGVIVLERRLPSNSLR
jgi:hypothetical protein